MSVATVCLRRMKLPSLSVQASAVFQPPPRGFGQVGQALRLPLAVCVVRKCTGIGFSEKAPTKKQKYDLLQQRPDVQSWSKLQSNPVVQKNKPTEVVASWVFRFGICTAYDRSWIK
eukprot:5405652-Amphidinium_carterae.1